MNENYNEKNISMLLLDLQHELLQCAQGRQICLMQACDVLEKKLEFHQQNNQRQIKKILNCIVL